MSERLLQHVEILENGRWTHIEPDVFEERFCWAERSFKHLYCGLCNQSVCFSRNSGTPYFKHAKYTKDCPEKSDPNGSRSDDFFNADEREFPIRLLNANEKSASFELGLFQLPLDILERNKERSFIIETSNSESSREWDFERLQNKGTTYFPIGKLSSDTNGNDNFPSSMYRLLLEDESIYEYWGYNVPGLDFSKPVWFDANSKKKLPRNADLCVGREYYLFSKRSAFGMFASYGRRVDVDISTKYTYKTDTGTIFLHKAIAKKFNDVTAVFFRETFGCRLTQNPVKLVPVWPPCVRDQYVVKIGKESKFAYFYFRGSGCVTAKTYPATASKTVENESGGLLRLNRENVQKAELISMGRTSVLQYALLWRESVNFQTRAPSVKIVDADKEDDRFDSDDEYSRLPKKGKLLLKHRFDGYYEIFQGERLTDKRALSRDGNTEVAVQWGTILKVYQSKDCVRKIVFKRQESVKLNAVDGLPSDRSLLERLRRQRGRSTPISPAFASIATKMSGYPQTKAWLRNALRQGEAPRVALDILKKTFIG